MLQLVLGGLVALWDEGDTGTTLKVDAQLRRRRLVAGQENEGINHNDNERKERQSALGPLPLAGADTTTFGCGHKDLLCCEEQG